MYIQVHHSPYMECSRRNILQLNQWFGVPLREARISGEA